MKIVIATKGRLTPMQRAYCLGYRRCLLRMRRELKNMVENELAGMKGVVDGIEADYKHAKQVAKAMAERTAMAERDPEVRLH